MMLYQLPVALTLPTLRAAGMRAGLAGGGAQNNDQYQRSFLMAVGITAQRWIVTLKKIRRWIGGPADTSWLDTLNCCADSAVVMLSVNMFSRPFKLESANGQESFQSSFR